MNNNHPVYVSRPALPPLADLLPLLEEIWASRILTNGGPIHQRFEDALSAHLGVEHLALVSNCTLGLMLALRQLRLEGEVITTPFSFVATAHALAWCGLEPVFADIEPHSLNVDPARIEAAITPRTVAILPVHSFGRPCDVAAISEIAERHGLKVVYDAAHAFGVDDEGGSVLRHGDLSVLSMHATKVFNTFEGGAVVCRDAETRAGIERLKNFGIASETAVESVGLNAKLNEFSAAVGLKLLEYVAEALALRRRADAFYRQRLQGTPGLRLLKLPSAGRHNYYSFPILLEDGFPTSAAELQVRLREHGIHARRYFYPLISELPMYCRHPSASAGNLPIAHRIASQVLCLPLFPGLEEVEQERITDLILMSGRRTCG